MNIGNLIFYVCVGVWVGGFCVEVVKWKIFDEISWFEIRISNGVSDSRLILLELNKVTSKSVTWIITLKLGEETV